MVAEIPYGGRTLKELLAHLAGADQGVGGRGAGAAEGRGGAQAAADAGGGEGGAGAYNRARAEQLCRIAAGRDADGPRLLLTLYEELEQKHLMMTLPSYGEEHNSVRERIWLGYHDRMHGADIRRALKANWEPPKLEFLPELREAVERLSPDETLYVVDSVDPTKWESPSVVPGWTNRNLLAHIASGDWVFHTHLRVW